MASTDATPFPIRGCIFRILPDLWLSTALPNTGPAGLDSEFSIDNGNFADCANEFTETQSTGSGYLDLTGAETNGSGIKVQIKSSTTNAIIYKVTINPLVLASVSTGTLSAGSAGGGTLGTILAYDITGCYIQTTGGTGGGGTGGANNQARKIVTYTISTGAFTVSPDWGTTPDNTTTYSVLLPPGMTLGALKALNPTTAGNTLDVNSGGEAGVDWGNVGNKTTSNALTGTTIATTQQVDLNTIKTQTVTCAAGVTILASVGAAAAPGSANGMLIGGSNAATTFAGLTTGALACTTITASGAVAFQSTFAVTTSTSLAALSATTVTFSGAVAFQSTFVVTTSTSLAALSCTTLTATGAVTLQSTLGITGAVTLSSTLATGAVTLNALTVTNVTTLTGAVTTGNVTFNSFTVTGTTLFNSNFGIAGTATIAALTVPGTTTFTTLSAGTLSQIAEATRDVDNTSPAANSLGEAVNDAATAGDPWSTALPGAYAAGTAGFILGNLTGGGGTGTNTITITVTDGTNPLQNVSYAIYDGAILAAFGTTDASGNADASLDNGTYEVALVKSGYTFVPVSRTVTGNQAGTLVNDLEMTAVIIPNPPVNPAKGTIYGSITYADGTAAEDVEITAQLMNVQGRTQAYSTGNMLVPNTLSTQTNALGEWSMDLFGNALITPLSTYWLVTISAANFTANVTVVAGDVENINALIV